MKAKIERWHWIDLLISGALSVVAVLLWPQRWIPQEGTSVAIASGALALLGLFLTAEIFVCTMMFTSSSTVVQEAVRNANRSVKHGWLKIFGTTALASVLPLVAIVVSIPIPKAAGAMTLFAIMLGSFKFARTLWWLHIVLNLEHRTPELEGKGYDVRIPEDRGYLPGYEIPGHDS